MALALVFELKTHLENLVLVQNALYFEGIPDGHFTDTLLANVDGGEEPS